ncbi:MAG TPA: YncE family protein [Candidatus Acidoferrum sp.]|nr:YncE family protein [Candidatus Acidoferrum sp.]
MKPTRAVTLALLLLLGVTAKAQDGAPLKLAYTIPLPGLKDGDFDHFAPDVDGHRLFLTGEENDKVLVFDTSTNKLIHTIEESKAPHAILYRGDLKKLFVVEGDASAVKVYDGESYKPLSEIKVSTDADSIAYDPATHYLYVVNGGREAHTPYSLISVIDTNSSKKLRDIKINSNHVEAIVLEKSGPRMFMNITGKDAVGVMDRNKSALAATWPLPAGDKLNVAMALDEANHRLFVVTRNPGKLIVLNSDTGKVVTSVPAVGMVDDMAYDAKQKRIYVAGDQFVDVFYQKDADHYDRLGRIPGSFRAKTGILVPELNRYYLAVPHHENHEAEVRVYEVQP